MASTRNTDVELTSFQLQPSATPSEDVEQLEYDVNSNEGFSLPSTDGGKEAWLCLLACFMLEAMIWGFPASYGIFQEYYTNNDFAGSENIAVAGACAMGLMYMDITIWFAVLKYFPNFRKWATPVGLIVVCSALGLASFSTTAPHLILTQGIMYALGGGLAWTPILFYIEEWWMRRRGFAYGVTMAGLGLSGAVLPLILEWLLHSHGFRTTLRICALSFVVLNLPTVFFFFKPRLPILQTSQSRNFDTSLGFFLPAIYLPKYARSLGANTIESTVTIILLNGAAFIGCLVMGTATDKYHVAHCLVVSAVGSAVGVFLLWGLSRSLASLYVFCVIYGAFAGCQSSAWNAIVRDTQQKRRGADSGMVWACLSAGKGVGNLCSGPLSGALLHAGDWSAGFAYGSDYGALIAFTGATALFSGWSFIAKRVGWLQLGE